MTQALAVQALLLARRVPAKFHIGVTRDPSGEFLAHAWVTSEERVLIGGDRTAEYQQLITLEGVAR
jgi:hypothetical protein